jgi:acetyl-CoA carboxylase carboxyl transferase subunit beta
MLKGQETYEKYRVCPWCRFHYTMSAQERIRLLMDAKGYKEKFKTVTTLDPLSFSGKVPYRNRLFRDQRRTGMNEAAVVARGRIAGRPAVLVCLDFGFMGGSMGCVVGEKVALAFEYAVKRHRPLVMLVSSAGVRMQEGVLSLMQMAKTTVAAQQLHQAGLPYICVLASPTTGQAYASFVNLSDILVAEPGAILGFSSLRVLQEVTSAPLPQGAHTAEGHLARGMVDLIVDRQQLRETVVQLLGMLSAEQLEAKPKTDRKRRRRSRKAPATLPAPEGAIRLATLPSRPDARAYIGKVFTNFVELHGDREGSDDPSVVCGIVNLDSATVMIIGQTPRPADTKDSPRPLTPEGLKKAQRALELAGKFHMPVITLIDSPGPDMSLQAEERGIGRAIASMMLSMAQSPVPAIAVIIGEGGRESAMAFSLADRILMQASAVFLPISAENAATLMYRDPGKSDMATQSLHLTARDCLEMGVIDAIVPEPPEGAHADPDAAAALLKTALVETLAELRRTSIGKLLKQRQQKFRNVGEYTSYFRMVLARELQVMRSPESVGEPPRQKRRRRGKETMQEPAKVLQLPTPDPDKDDGAAKGV